MLRNSAPLLAFVRSLRKQISWPIVPGVLARAEDQNLF